MHPVVGWIHGDGSRNGSWWRMGWLGFSSHQRVVQNSSNSSTGSCFSGASKTLLQIPSLLGGGGRVEFRCPNKTLSGGGDDFSINKMLLILGGRSSVKSRH